MLHLQNTALAMERFLAAHELMERLQSHGHLAANIDVGGLAFDHTIGQFGDGPALRAFTTVVLGMVEARIGASAVQDCLLQNSATPSTEKKRLLERDSLRSKEGRALASLLARLIKAENDKLPLSIHTSPRG